jgi:hypothetical protein
LLQIKTERKERRRGGPRRDGGAGAWSRSSRALRGEDDIDQKKEGKRRGTGRGRKGSGPGGGEKKRGERARERGIPREGFGFSLFSFYLKHLNSKPVSVLNLKQR